MQSTMQLLTKALQPEYGMSATKWCEKLGVNRSNLAMAKVRGRLSPTMAGKLAVSLGEDAIKWIAIAALEAEPESNGKQELVNQFDVWRKR